MRRLSLLLSALVVLGCEPRLTKPVENERDPPDHDHPPHDHVLRDVDILFVIDNSGSMAEEQANLAANFGAFIDVLEAEGVRADYRIGITTTDNGNPRCQGTSPEGGKLQLSSCRSRPEDFSFTGNPPVEAFDTACATVCSPQAHAALEQGMLPSFDRSDWEEKPRPWVESLDGETNLPGGITAAEALACLGPQGIAGCGMEQPLESMYKALSLASYPGSPQRGFLREQANLAIIIVTDEADCSHNQEFGEVFTEPNVFWSDPEALLPTSAVCWNAGVECEGEGGTYDACEPVNFDLDGTSGVGDEQAVMRPLGRYADLVQSIEYEKKDINPDQDVIVAVLSGVPEGYSERSEEIEYADADDPEFQRTFGIGPGCQVGDQRAVPPVRLRVFAEHFNSNPEVRQLYSICSEDYTPALRAIAESITGQVRPACYRQCVADTDESTPEVDPLCVVEYTLGDVTSEVPECSLVGEEYVLSDEDSTVCWIPLVTHEPGQPDSMSPACVQDGWNLEIGLVWADAAPIAPWISVTCELSGAPEQDCPDLD